MSTLLFANNAGSTLSGSITNVSTSLSLAAGGGALFPNPSAGQTFTITVKDAATGLLTEIMSCTARSGDVLTVVRAQEGTIAQNWNANDTVQHLWTAGQAAQMLQQGQAPSSIQFFGATDSGGVNTIISTVSPALGALADGQVFELTPAHANTSTTPTANLSATGAIVIKRPDGTALAVGDIQGPGSRIQLSYQASGPAYLLLNPMLWASTNTGIKQVGGQCVFQISSTTLVKLNQRDGYNIIVNGQQLQIPLAGVSGLNTGVYVNGVAAQNLVATTAYYVSLAVITGVLTLRFWNAATYSHQPDSNTANLGVEVISLGGVPMSTDSLVGMVYMAGTTFQDTNAARYLISWFNRAGKPSQSSFTANRTTSSATLAEVNTEIRNGFICWSGDPVTWGVVGACSNSAASAGLNGVSFDGAAAEPTQQAAIPFAIANNSIPISFGAAKTGLTENVVHYATLVAGVQGNTTTFYFANALAGSAPSLASVSATRINLVIQG